MSVITHRQFAAVVRDSGYGNSQKMTDLLERIHLKKRILSTMETLPKIIETKIDYSSTDEEIMTERQKTQNYLERWIG